MPLGKHWLGPTIYTWGEDQCKNLRTYYRENLGACKETCKITGSCNAIEVKETNLQVVCDLKDCRFPVPAPIYLPADKLLKGYCRATGKKSSRHLEYGLM